MDDCGNGNDHGCDGRSDRLDVRPDGLLPFRLSHRSVAGLFEQFEWKVVESARRDCASDNCRLWDHQRDHIIDEAQDSERQGVSPVVKLCHTVDGRPAARLRPFSIQRFRRLLCAAGSCDTTLSRCAARIVADTVTPDIAGTTSGCTKAVLAGANDAAVTGRRR